MCCFLIVQRIFALTSEKEHRVAVRITGIALLIILLGYVIVFFQFTVVAGVLCATALFLLASSKGQLKIPGLIMVWLLLQFGGLIRRKVMFM